MMKVEVDGFMPAADGGEPVLAVMKLRRGVPKTNGRRSRKAAGPQKIEKILDPLFLKRTLNRIRIQAQQDPGIGRTE